MRRKRFFRDAYGSTAECFPVGDGTSYHVVVHMGEQEDARLCPDIVHALRFMAAYGHAWTEVER